MAEDININLTTSEILGRIQAGESGVSIPMELDTSNGQHVYKAVNAEIQKYLDSQKAVVISATQIVNLLTRGYKDFDDEIESLTKQLSMAQGEEKEKLAKQLQEVQKFRLNSEKKAPVGTEIHKLLELQEKGEIQLDQAVKSAKHLLEKMVADSKSFEELRTLIVPGNANKTQQNFQLAFAQAKKMSDLKVKAGLTGGKAETPRASTLFHNGKLYIIAGTTDYSKDGVLADYKTTSEFHPDSNIIQTAVNANNLRAELGKKDLAVRGKIVNAPTTAYRTAGRNPNAIYDISVGSYQQIEDMERQALDIYEGKRGKEGIVLPGSITGSTLPPKFTPSTTYGGSSLSQLQKQFLSGKLPANKLRGLLWKGIEKEKTGGSYEDLVSRLFFDKRDFWNKDFINAIYAEDKYAEQKRTPQDSSFTQTLKDIRGELERKEYAQNELGYLSEYDTRHDPEVFKEIFGEEGARQQEYAKYQLEDEEANVGFYLERFGDDLNKKISTEDPARIAHLLSRTYAAQDIYDTAYSDILNELNANRGEGQKLLETPDILSESQREEYYLSSNLRKRFQELSDGEENFSYIKAFGDISKGGVFPGQTGGFARLMSWMNRLQTDYPILFDENEQNMEETFRQYGLGGQKKTSALRNPKVLSRMFEGNPFAGLTSSWKTAQEQYDAAIEEKNKAEEEWKVLGDNIEKNRDDKDLQKQAESLLSRLILLDKNIETLKEKLQQESEPEEHPVLTTTQEQQLSRMTDAYSAFLSKPFIAESEFKGEPEPLPEYLTSANKTYGLDTVYEPNSLDNPELLEAFQKLSEGTQETANEIITDTVNNVKAQVVSQKKRIKGQKPNFNSPITQQLSGAGFSQMYPVQVFGRGEADLLNRVEKQILTDEEGKIIGKLYQSVKPKEYVNYGEYSNLQGWETAFAGKTREEAEQDLTSRFAQRRIKQSGELYANDAKTVQSILDKVFGGSSSDNELLKEVRSIRANTDEIKEKMQAVPENWNSDEMQKLFSSVSSSGGSAVSFAGSTTQKRVVLSGGSSVKDINAYKKNTKLITDYQKDIEAMQKTLNTTPTMLEQGRTAIEKMIEMRTQDKQALIEENELMLAQGKLTQQEAEQIDAVAAAQREYNSLKIQGQKSGANSIFDVLKSGVKNTLARMFDYTGVYRVLNKIAASFQNVVQLSKELDTAMFNLRVVSGDTRSEAQGLISDYNDLAKQLGATTVEIANAANEWMRQGYEAEQATKLITASTYLSKLGMIDASQATEYLTSMIKGFKLEVSDAVTVVDKLTKLDMVSATSAGGLAEAMQNVASSAQLAGVSMDKTLAYAATIIETTQRDESSVGMALRTVLARYGNVKAGAFSNLNLAATGDADLENINDIEKVLKKIGISIRSSATEFRSFETVLDEVADKWDRLDSVSQNAIATAFAGQRQRESFLVLMENMDRVEELTEISEESAGTATEKYQAYYETVESATKRLQTAWENLAHSFEVNGFVKGMTTFLTFVVENLPKIIKMVATLVAQTNAWKLPTLLKAGFNATGLGALKTKAQTDLSLSDRYRSRFATRQNKQREWKNTTLEDSGKLDIFGLKTKMSEVSKNIESLVFALDANTQAQTQQTRVETLGNKSKASTSAEGYSVDEWLKSQGEDVSSDVVKAKTKKGKEKLPKFNLKNMQSDEDMTTPMQNAIKTGVASAAGAGLVAGVIGGITQEGSTEAKVASGAVQGAAAALGGIASIWLGPLGTMLGSVLGDVLGPIVADAVDKEANDRKKLVEVGQKQLDMLSSLDSSFDSLDASSRVDQLSADDISSIRDIVSSIEETIQAEDSNLGDYLEQAFKDVGASEFYENWDSKLILGSQEERRSITRALQLAKSEAESAAYESSMAEKKYAALTTAEAKTYYKKVNEAEVERAYIKSGVSEYSQYELTKKGIDGVINEVAKQLEGVDLKGIRLRDSFGDLTEEAEAYIRTLMKSDDQMQDLLAGQTLTLNEALQENNTDLLDQFATALGVSIEKLEGFADTIGALTLADLLAGMGETREKITSYTGLLSDFFSTGTISPENLEDIIANYPDLINKIADPQALLSGIQEKVSQLGTQYVSAGISSWFSSEAVFEQFRKNFADKEGFGDIFSENGLLGNVKTLDEAKGIILKMQEEGSDYIEQAKELYDYILKTGDAAQVELEYISKQLQDTAEIEAIMDRMDKNYEKQIDALTEQKSALEDINSQREYENKLIEAKIKLENAQNEKKKVWREGVGWVYEADTSAIAEAQEELDDLANQKTIEELQAQIDELQARRDYVADIPDRLELEQANENFKAWTDKLGLVNDDQLSVINKIQEVWTDLKARSDEMSGKSETKSQFESATQQQASAEIQLVGAGGSAEAPAEGSAQKVLQDAYAKTLTFDQSDNSEAAKSARTAFADALKKYQTAYSSYIEAGGTATQEQQELNALSAESDDLRFAPKWEDVQLPGGYYKKGEHNFDVYASFEDVTDTGGWKQGGMKDVVLLSPIRGRADKEGISGFGDLRADKYNGQLFLNTKGDDQLFWVYNDRVYRATRNSGQYKKTEGVNDSTYSGEGPKSSQNLTSADNFKWYAEGTLSAPGGLSMVNDDPQYGLEGIITPNGTLTALPSKSGVVPADMTRNVWQLGEVAPNLIKQLVDINGKFNSPLGFGTDESFNVDHLDVHMVAQPGFDMDDFVRKLRAARDLSKHS